MQFFFVYVSVVSYVAFVLSLFDLRLFWCLRKAVLCNCDIPWVSSHTFSPPEPKAHKVGL